MTFGERVQELRKKAGLTQLELAKEIGYDSKGSISKIENDVLDVNQSTIVALARVLKVDLNELLDYQNPKEPSNIRAFVPTNKIKMIPLFESVSAGFGAYASDEVIDYIPTVIMNPNDVEDTIAIHVSGDSMYPKIEDGDTIVVRKQTSVDSGSIAVLLLDGEEGLVKKVNYGDDWIELVSLNPEYQTRRFEGEEVTRLQVVGLVKQVIKTF